MQAAQLMMMPMATVSGDVLVSGLNAEQPEQGDWFGQLLGENLATELDGAVSKQPVFTVPLSKTEQADPLKSEDLNMQLAALLSDNLMPEQVTAYLHQAGVMQPAAELVAETPEPEVEAEAVKAVTVDTAMVSTGRPEMLEVNKMTEQIQQSQPVTAEAVKPEVTELVKPEAVETARPVVAEAVKVAVQPAEVSKPDVVVPQQAQPQPFTAEAVKLDVAELVKPEAVETARPVVAEAAKVVVQPTEVSKPDAVVPQQVQPQPQPITAEAVKPEIQQHTMQQQQLVVEVEKPATPATAVKQAQSAPEQQVVTQQQPVETDKQQATVVQQPVKFAQQPDVVVAVASSNNQQEMKQDQKEQPVLQGKPLAETTVQEKPVLTETGQETTGQARGMEQHLAVNHAADKPVQAQQAQQVAEAPQPQRQEPVARQVAEHLSGYNFKPGTEQVTLKLSPENLGNLQLNISMDDNRLRLDIVADTRVARDALLQQADELRESLSRQNIKVDSFNVTTGNGGSQYQHQQFANWQQTMPQQKQHQPQYAPTRHQNYPEAVAGSSVQYFAPQYQSTINVIS